MRFSFGSDNNVEKSLKQAEKYAQQGKLANAIDEYQKVLEANPHDENVLNTVGDLCVRVGRPEEASRYFVQVAERYESEGAVQRAIAVYKKIVKLEGVAPELTIKLADMLRKVGHISDARVQYMAAVESFKRTGDKAKALTIQQKIADLDPENVTLRLELAEAYLASGMQREAYNAFIQAGQELQRRGRADEGLEAFRKALEVRPDSKIAINALAEGYVQQGRLVEALRMIDGLLTKNPEDPDLLAILGRTYLNAGMLDEAEETFGKLLRVDATRVDAMLEVSRACIEAKLMDRALAIVDRSVDSLLATGAKKKLTAVLKEILRRDRNNVGALRRLADIYTRVDERRNLVATLNSLVEVSNRQGLKDIATEALKRLMEVEPDVVAKDPAAADAPPPPAPAAESNFPEGFESGPMLMEWARKTPSVEEPASTSSADRAVPAAESAGALSEYSMELADDLVAEHPEFRAARIKLLEELVAGQPKYVIGRTKLKKLYAEAGMKDKAAVQCIELARLHEELGETERAKEFIAEAYDLHPSVQDLSAQVVGAHPASEDRVDLDEMFTLAEFNKYFDREWRRAIRDEKPLALVKLEIDAFNDYLDTYGLLSGDYCLERVAGTLEGDLLRPGDLISSVGGGVFLVLLPDTPESAVSIVADRLRTRIEAMRIRHEASPVSDVVTVSLGAAAAVPDPKFSSDTLIVAADDALLQAKVDGGNRVVTAPLIMD
ncbi:MAG: tetratricopeptide repeat protein [Blastocatellia bacterium]